MLIEHLQLSIWAKAPADRTYTNTNTTGNNWGKAHATFPERSYENRLDRERAGLERCNTPTLGANLNKWKKLTCVLWDQKEGSMRTTNSQ